MLFIKGKPIKTPMDLCNISINKDKPQANHRLTIPKNITYSSKIMSNADNSYSDFGGRSEGQDKGRWDITAVREFYEETVGAIMNIPTMISRLQHKKNYTRTQGKTLNGSPYYMYIVKIPFRENYRETNITTRTRTGSRFYEKYANNICTRNRNTK